MKKRLPLILGILAACCIGAVLIGTFLPEPQPTPPPPPTSTPAPLPTATSTPTQAEQYLAEYGGDLQSYEEIFALTDCALLQDKFDTAAANNDRETPGTPLFRITLGYMTATDQHMRDIGCY